MTPPAILLALLPVILALGGKSRPEVFTCEEDFGYHPHPEECDKYYVCVFGGAFLESCTGGLLYSHDLQTCDWPRNVICNSSATTVAAPSPILASTPGYDLDSLKGEEGNFQTDNEADSSRLGRSYEGSVPNYKEELYAGRRRKREAYGRVVYGPHPGYGMYPPSYYPIDTTDTTSAPKSLFFNHQNNVHHQPQHLQPQLQPQLQSTQLQQRSQFPTVRGATGAIRFPNSGESKTGGFLQNPLRPVLPVHHLQVGHPEGEEEEEEKEEFHPTLLPTTTTTAIPLPRPTTTDKTAPTWTYDDDYYYDDDDQEEDERSAAGRQKNQQEIIIDPEYLNQRYAANAVPLPIPTQAPVRTTTATTTTTTTTKRTTTTTTPNPSLGPYYDPDSYYVYDDELEPQQYDDVDYKPFPASTTTTTTVRPRGTARHKPASGRPTLKPSSSIVKDVVTQVRDVYLDPPSRPPQVYESPVPNSPSTKCKKDICVLPDCNCGGKEIPGGLRVDDVPQIVLLTFDDSVNDLNKDLYRDLFEKGRKNPNGCPISATFYVSHEWTDYSQVQNLAADGHEIASHSVSHSFGEQFSQKKWEKEINGQREILAAYGGVKLSEVRGMRAPFLAIGGNNMFKMLYDSNFTYDSSMPVYENRPPSWPYTLDYRIFHDCMIPPCPTKSYPSVWEVPMVMWQDLKGGRCSMGDACSNPPNAEGVYQMLVKNFERHYTTNRAPFGLYYHAAWFTQPHHKEGFEAFLDTLVNMDDVWLVTNWQALQWIRQPTPLSRILNFEPWSCHNKERPPRCNHPRVCNLWHKSGVRYMKTCQQCPGTYPWTGNTGVTTNHL